MYSRYYGMSAEPFSLHSDTQTFFGGKQYASARTMLDYAVLRRDGIVLISGEIGCGKSMLVRSFLAHAPENVVLGVISNPALLENSLVHGVAQAFSLDRPDSGGTQLFAHLHTFMQAHYAAGRTVMLIVDEAQYLSQSSLEQLRMLTNPEADSEGALQLVLVGQPQLKQTLNHPDLSQLMQRVVVNMHLGPLGATECRDYIQFRLRVAGTEKPIFTNSALSAIYHGSRGVPRMINMICDMALLYGYAEEMSQIDEAVVAQVIADRGMPGNEVMTPAAGPVPRLESTSIEAVSKQQEDMDREIARQLFKLSVPHR